MKNKLFLTLILLCIHALSQATPFDKADANAGKKIFDHHKCNSCHASLLGGDGSTMFTKANHKIKTPDSLKTQVQSCSTNLGLMMFEDDVENVSAYLNKNYYKFK
jgi:cytochrome c peroxidase